jgi:hypothetical protein
MTTPSANGSERLRGGMTARAADVIAHAGDDAEDAVAMREGELGTTEGDFG